MWSRPQYCLPILLRTHFHWLTLKNAFLQECLQWQILRIIVLFAGVFNCRKKWNCLYKQKCRSDGFPVLTNTKVNAGVLVGFNSCENEYCGLHEYETVWIGRELGLEALWRYVLLCLSWRWRKQVHHCVATYPQSQSVMWKKTKYKICFLKSLKFKHVLVVYNIFSSHWRCTQYKHSYGTQISGTVQYVFSVESLIKWQIDKESHHIPFLH